jgi:hypothetical protein
MSSRRLTPWSESWIEAIEREREQLESLPASALIAAIGETEAMLIDEVIADIAFEQHIGPWLDDEHEEQCWEAAVCRNRRAGAVGHQAPR